MGFFLFARIISLGVETIVIYGKFARPFARRGESSVGDGGDGRGKGRLADGAPVPGLRARGRGVCRGARPDHCSRPTRLDEAESAGRCVDVEADNLQPCIRTAKLTSRRTIPA